jgi:folate-binding protein YgfZ
VFGDLQKDQDTLIFNIDPRNANIGLKLIHPKNNPKILDNLNNISEVKYHEILIKNLVPLSHYDLEENKSLLLENNFENLNSISWDKGCYVGQEITARMKYRALLKKKIYSLEIKDGSPIIGQLIKDNESEFGKIISIKNNFVLAMLKIELADKKIITKKQIKTNEGLILEFIL